MQESMNVNLVPKIYEQVWRNKAWRGLTYIMATPPPPPLPDHKASFKNHRPWVDIL